MLTWLFLLLYPLLEYLAWRRINATVSDTTLLIVDMQDDFPCSRPIVDAVCREVDLATKYGWSIIVLEFRHRGKGKPTYSKIMDKVRAARVPKVVLQKDREDGAAIVLEACRKHNLGTTRIRACGVKLLHCLALTVSTMARSLPESQFQVVRQASNGDHDSDFAWFHCESNVTIVEQDDVADQLGQTLTHCSIERSSSCKVNTQPA